ncbi:MAG TPA: DUF3500 domain-containing protein [Acidobacteriota bacterium]
MELPVRLVALLLAMGAARAGGAPPAAEAPAAAMRQAALAFLATLSPEQRESLLLPFGSEARTDWHYTPRRRAGLALADLSAAQREAALAWLRSGVGRGGYRKAETIRQLELVLREQEGPFRDPLRYHFALFGDPADAAATWGWRYEGHHISLHWTLTGAAIAAAPQFLGADPATVRHGRLQGTRALAREEDLARGLMIALQPAQRRVALVSETAPSDILSGTERRAAALSDGGIRFRDLDPPQRERLLELIEEYASVQPPPLAQERMRTIRAAGPDSIRFAWMGALEPGRGHYYRIHGPGFLIEYDNTQDQANHIHTVWRDLEGDFGPDLLAHHYRTAPHHQAQRRGQNVRAGTSPAPTWTQRTWAASVSCMRSKCRGGACPRPMTTVE